MQHSAPASSCCCRWACARSCRTMTTTGNGIRLNRPAREEVMCGPRNLWRGAGERGRRMSQHPPFAWPATSIARRTDCKTGSIGMFRMFRRSLAVFAILSGKAKLKGNAHAFQDPPENDDGRGHPTPLRRALIFVLLGPVLGILVAFYLAGEGHRDLY